jgi:catechol 2,3-dioxygenase-like lactoylglutathione lyase family enzyme
MAFKSPLWEGVHVVALVTPDMDTTMRFWHEVLGAEIVATESNDVYRAYYFRVGEVQTVAFLEYHGVDHERYAKPAGVSYPLASQFDHLGLNLGSRPAVTVTATWNDLWRIRPPGVEAAISRAGWLGSAASPWGRRTRQATGPADPVA